jgi:hypothetical protein
MNRIDFEDLNKLLRFFYHRQKAEPFYVKGTILAMLSLTKIPDYVDDVAHLIVNDHMIENILHYFEFLGLVKGWHPYSIRRKWYKITEEGIRFYQQGGFKFDIDYHLAC